MSVLDEAGKERLVEQFRAGLDLALGEFGDEGHEGDAVDLRSLLSEMAVLKNEVRLQARQFKAALEELHGLGEALRLQNERLQRELDRAREQTAAAGAQAERDLLLGLLSPTTGQILIDGRPLVASHLDAWRRQVSYVAQDTFLFADTVRANLAWALPAATDSDLWEALRHAAADRFVAELPQGLDTRVGERGVQLSGGERQRLSIARALLRKPRVLVLDEATSSLDSENELRIQQAIDGLQHRMTIVIIAHRLSTIRNADVIHVMEAGRVVQSGTWHQLRGQPQGRFFELATRNADGPAGELA